MSIFSANFQKPGPGVSKDTPVNYGIGNYFEVLFAKIGKMIPLNIVYVLLSLTVVLFGPATAGLTYVLRKMVSREPTFGLSDFWDSFKENWKQSAIVSVIDFAVIYGSYIAYQYYMHAFETGTSGMMLFLFIMMIIFWVLYFTMRMYIYLIIVTIDMPLYGILKNAYIFAFLGLKRNFLGIVGIALLLYVGIILIPFPLSLIPVLIILPAALSFTATYAAYPVVKKYMIDPLLEMDEEEEEEAIFSDKLITEDEETEKTKNKRK